MDYRPVGGRDLYIHVFSPAGGGAHRPAALMFFGGGFQNGDVSSLAMQAKRFADDHGYVAAVADYRVFCRDATRPADAFEDAGDARDWMRADAARLGIDPGRLVLVGESSGGALAAATALRAPPDARPEALVLFNPGTDLRIGPWAAQMTPEQLSSLLPAAALPPTIVFHGTADRLVPIATARAFCDPARAAGRTCRLVEARTTASTIGKARFPASAPRRSTTPSRRPSPFSTRRGPGVQADIESVSGTAAGALPNLGGRLNSAA